MLVRVVDEGQAVAEAADALDVDRETVEGVLDRYVATQHKRTTPPVYTVGGRRSATRPVPGHVSAHAAGGN